MRVRVDQSELNKALIILSRIASSRTPLPILSNIKLVADNNGVKLSSTNLEVAITCDIRSKTEESGLTTVPAKLFSDFVNQLPKTEEVELKLSGNKLSIKSGVYSSVVQGVSAEDFPELPEVKMDNHLSLSPHLLKKAFERTILAASNDETRPILGGIYLHSQSDFITAAATDGYRLAEYKIVKSDIDVSMLVPSGAVHDALKIIQEDDETGGDAELVFDESQFALRYKNTELVSRLVDGKYPQYSQLIPKDSDISLEITRSELITAAKIAGLFARESGGSITLVVSESDQKLTVSSIASQVGENSSVIDCSVKGSGKVVLNVRYLLDALGCFNSDKIKFEFSGSINPCVMSSDEEPNYKHIIMPLKS